MYIHNKFADVINKSRIVLKTSLDLLENKLDSNFPDSKSPLLSNRIYRALGQIQYLIDKNYHKANLYGEGRAKSISNDITKVIHDTSLCVHLMYKYSLQDSVRERLLLPNSSNLEQLFEDLRLLNDVCLTFTEYWMDDKLLTIDEIKSFHFYHHVSKDKIRSILNKNGFTIEQGCVDFDEKYFEAAYALLDYRDGHNADKPPLDIIKSAARQCGYAVTIHGSEIRDYDLVAIPWTENALSAQELIDSVKTNLSKYLDLEVRELLVKRDSTKTLEDKPHGRKTVSLQLAGWYKVIDFSIIEKP